VHHYNIITIPLKSAIDDIVREEICASRSVFLQEIRRSMRPVDVDSIQPSPHKGTVDYFSMGFVSIYSISVTISVYCPNFMLAQTLQFEYGSGAQGSRISEEETTPRCLSGPSSTSLFPVIFSCVGVGRNVRRCSAGSWDMYWKKGEESLLSLCSGLPTECSDIYSYGYSLAFSRWCSEKED